MTTDFRDALQELHTSIQLYTGQNPAAADVHPAELTRRLMDAMAASAAALAQPEPVAPTDEQTFELADNLGIIRGHGGDLHVSLLDLTPFAESVLARYGTPAIQPVPVSERLPGPEDLNGEGWCWWFDGLNWMLDEPENWYTHWLPHHALPTPEATNA